MFLILGLFNVSAVILFISIYVLDAPRRERERRAAIQREARKQVAGLIDRTQRLLAEVLELDDGIPVLTTTQRDRAKQLVREIDRMQLGE